MTTDWVRKDKTLRDKYRLQIRKTFQGFTDEALLYQDARIAGGIDREECDREIDRRHEGGTRVV